MTVRELIKKLQEFDSDKQIVVEGYESGYDDIQVIKEQQVVVQEDCAWWDGNYQLADEGQTVVCLIAKIKSL